MTNHDIKTADSFHMHISEMSRIYIQVCSSLVKLLFLIITNWIQLVEKIPRRTEKLFGINCIAKHSIYKGYM